MLPAMVSAAPATIADPTYYPIEEKVGEDSLQRFIVDLLRGAIDDYLVRLGKPTFVGADQFIYWAQHRPQKVVAPDVYILPGIAREARIPCLKTWEAGVVPSFALEIVSSNDVDKDYREAPERYDELGVNELVVFDPDHHRGRDRLRFQLFRRVRGRGLVRITATNEDRVRSRVLGCWIRAVGKGDKVRLRLATGERGDAVVPTALEAANAEVDQQRALVDQQRALVDQQRALADQQRALADQQRALADQATARAEAAEAELAKLKAASQRKKTTTKK
jgi:hypothetical protein